MDLNNTIDQMNLTDFFTHQKTTHFFQERLHVRSQKHLNKFRNIEITPSTNMVASTESRKKSEANLTITGRQMHVKIHLTTFMG